jgi:hypothetical protein
MPILSAVSTTIFIQDIFFHVCGVIYIYNFTWTWKKCTWQALNVGVNSIGLQCNDLIYSLHSY